MRPVHRTVRGGVAAIFTVGLLAFGPAAAQTTRATAPTRATPPASSVPPAIQAVRAYSLAPPYNVVAFRSMEKFSETRPVVRAGPIWRLPRSERPLDFRYSHDGQSYTPEQFMDRTFGNALLVIKDGRIVHESYRNMGGEDDRYIGFSMTKSVTSILVGKLVEEGRIRSLDDRIERYLPELKGGAYEGVTIRQVLQMRSGIEYRETYDPSNEAEWVRGTPAAALVDNVARYVDAARTVTRARAPGSAFEYKNLDTAVLGLLIERTSGGSIASYMTTRLWEPLGAEHDGFFLMDGPAGVGREFNIAGYNATLRDWGRIGQMMLDGGVANGRRVVSSDWVRESTRPLGSDRQNGWGYGYQWWTLGDAYAARGLAGQSVFVDPPSRTVIVKLSYFPPRENGGASPLQAESDAFFRAASAWTPR